MSSSESTSESSSGSFKLDYDTVVRVRYLNTDHDDKEEEESVLSHRQVLSLFSPMFSRLIADASISSATSSSATSSSSSSSEDSIISIDLDLTMFQNSLAAFKIMLEALYTGDVKLTNAMPNEVLAICRFCQVSSIETKIMALQHQLAFNINNLFNTPTPSHHISPTPHGGGISKMVGTPPPPTMMDVLMAQHHRSSTVPEVNFPNYFASMLQMWANPFLAAINSAANSTTTISPKSDGSSSRTQSEGSSPRANSVATPPNSDLEKIVPNDDKEGWCRNKKYIEKVENGFMCTVCRKIYGRYNSVSYHVTIYHRNPPIRCEENGCNFSTREARYIHFHKYYRHHIPLPENIDLGSRKCPFCRHVSKSPAMLDKHIARHETENGHTGALKRASNKKKPIATLPDLLVSTVSSSTSSLLGTINPLPCTVPTVSTPMKCSLCPFTAFGTEMLFVHLTSTHAQELAQLIGNGNEQISLMNSSSEPVTVSDDVLDIKPFLNLNAAPLKFESS